MADEISDGNYNVHIGTLYAHEEKSNSIQMLGWLNKQCEEEVFLLINCTVYGLGKAHDSIF